QYKSLVEYRLVALADYIILAQLGEIVMPGVWARKSYLKGTLDKLGLETEIDYIGRFKSAHETFSRKDMSEADSIQWSAILDDVYEPAVNDAELGRGFSRAEIESLINRSGYWNSQDAKLNRLIDTTAFFYDVDDIAKKIFDQKVKVVEVNKVLDKKVVSRAWTEKRPKIALVIGEGAIIVGKSGYNPVPIVGGKYIGSETIAKIFEKIRKDKSIKAVVFRINSGGGSALASDIICEAVRRCDKEKPVIVSMGGVAGSGGYYIACQARKILADNSTITGSIGVVSVKIITRRFFDEKIGITYDWIKRGEHIDAFSDLRHFTKEESLHFHQEIEWWYDKFLDRIVQGRKLEKSFVDSIGQGRIWSGRRAKELGLIDENGGLMDAIELAKKEAGIKKDVEIVFYPRAEKRFGINNPAGAQDITRLLSERFLYLMPYDVTIE
ncbi:MAG: signal peptide peptidase SppA, partial [candidate division WOR-3 bacterium]